MRFLFYAVLVFVVAACGNNQSTRARLSDHTPHVLADTMMAIDEMGGLSDSYVQNRAPRKFIATRAPRPKFDLANLLLPEARAAGICGSGSWAACASNVVVRTYRECKLGDKEVDGKSTFTYEDAAVDSTCSLSAADERVSRRPNYKFRSDFGGTVTLDNVINTKGDIIVRVSSTDFRYQNGGIRRILAINGAPMTDYTSVTLSQMTVTGASRSGRTLSGGLLRITNNLTAVTCDYVPSAVTWNSTCTCGVSGTWTSTCSNGSSTRLVLNGCGKATYTDAYSTTSEVNFEVCGAP